MKASLNQYRQSPRKVRLVADFVKGKPVEQALLELKYTTKRASDIVSKLLSSAVANAVTNSGKEARDLFIKEIRVDAGPTLKRFMPRARGSASRINKRTSHITVVLGEKAAGTPKTAKKVEAPKEEAGEVEAKPKTRKKKEA